MNDENILHQYVRCILNKYYYTTYNKIFSPFMASTASVSLTGNPRRGQEQDYEHDNAFHRTKLLHVLQTKCTQLNVSAKLKYQTI